MSAMQDLSPYIEQFHPAMKQAKEDQRFTIARLSQASGVSEPIVTKTMAGMNTDPKLYNSVALCRVLGLSIDRLFGFPEPEPPPAPEELLSRLRDLELENARLCERAGSAARHVQVSRTAAFSLMALCALLTVALIVYLAVDNDIHDAGLILSGRPTFAGWVLIALAALSAALNAALAVRLARIR